jgi:transcription initiation factor IIE alpha subunit
MRETKGGMREHPMLQSAMAPIIEKETEGEPEEVAAAEVTTASPQLSDEERKVLEALANGEKVLRTRTSLARQAGMLHSEVSRTVETLRARKLVGCKEMKEANGAQMRRWYINTKGRGLVEARLSTHSTTDPS